MGEYYSAPWLQPGWLFSNHIEDATHLAQNIIRGVESKSPLPQVSLVMRLVVRMLDRNPARRPLIAEVVANLITQPGFSGHCCRSTKSRSSDTDTKASIDNVMSGPSELADHQLNSSHHLTSSSSVVNSLFKNRTHHPNMEHGSYEKSSQESSWASVIGQKRSLTQASPDQMPDILPRKRMESDLPSPHHRDFPILPPVHATSSEEKYRQLTQPADHHRDVPEEIGVSRYHLTTAPPSTTEFTQLPSLNRLLHLRESGQKSVPHYPGAIRLPAHWKPPLGILAQNAETTTVTPTFIQLSPNCFFSTTLCTEHSSVGSREPTDSALSVEPDMEL